MQSRLQYVKNWLSTTQIIAMGFMGIIVTGTILLMLPVSSAAGDGTNFFDALFTATTSVCVTGLVTVPTYLHWSVFGKLVILILIQLGGLGFMTCFTCLLLILKKELH